MTSEQTDADSLRAFVCPHCDTSALATVRGLAFWDGWDRGKTDVLSPPTEYALVQCNVCADASLQVREDYGDGFKADDPVLIYPAQRRISMEVPEPLRREFEQAQTCFAAKAYTATVVMVRRVLEGTCKENGIQERTLVKSLVKMKEVGLIDGTVAAWADALRVLGNEGAHYTGNSVGRDDAEDALAFAEALLDHIYVLRKRFDDFAKRRTVDNHG